MNDYVGLTKRLRIVSEPVANIDINYGPYDSIEEANSSIPINLRAIGLTVGIKTLEGVVDYCWKENITNAGLVLKNRVIEKVSELDNDLNYTTEEEVANVYATDAKLNTTANNLGNSINTTKNNLIEYVDNKTTKFKGYYTTAALLKSAYPAVNNEKDFFAWVGTPYPGTVYKVNSDGGAWTNTSQIPDQSVDLTNYLEEQAFTCYVANKEDGIIIRESENKISIVGLRIVLSSIIYIIPDIDIPVIPITTTGTPASSYTGVLIVNKDTLEVRNVTTGTGYGTYDKKVWFPIAVITRSTNSSSTVGRVINVEGNVLVHYDKQNAKLNNYIFNAHNNNYDSIYIANNGRTININSNGFSFIYKGVRYVISGGGNSGTDITLDRISGQVRSYIYIDTSKLNPSGTTNWNDTNIFVTVGNVETNLEYMVLFAAYYINTLQDVGLIANIINKQRTINKSDKKYTIKQVYNGLSSKNYPVQVFINQDKIVIPRSMLIFDDSTGEHKFSGEEKEISRIPTDWNGVTQASSNGVILFNPVTREIRNIVYTLAYNYPSTETWWRIANIKSIPGQMAYLACTFEWVIADGGQESSSIVQRNTDIETAVDAIINRRYSDDIASMIKRFTFVHESDIHGDTVRHSNILDYINYKSYIDALITTGDIVASNFTNDFTFFSQSKTKISKDILPVLGNHDVGTSTLKSLCGTTAECYTRYIQPFEQYGIVTNGKNYWYKDYANYNIRIIALYEYDNEDDNTEDPTQYRLIRGYKVFSQEQINWFIATLNSTPSNYHVIILTHLASYGDYSECEWVDEWTDRTSRYTTGIVNQSYIDGNPIGAIVNAWIKGIAINLSWGFIGAASYLTPITANHDFTARGAGIFVGYFHGHYHRDGLCTLVDYPEQHVYRTVGSSAKVQVIRRTDLNRTQGTKSEDSFNVCSVDTVNRKLYIVRVGANITDALQERKFTSWNY